MHKTKPDSPKYRRLVEALKAGNYMNTACLYAGFAESTVYRWISAAEEYEAHLADGGERDKKMDNVLMLADGVRQARAEAETRNVFVISKAANDGTWQAAAWWLERTSPKRWGRYVRTEISGPDEGPVRMRFSNDDLESLVDQILADEPDRKTAEG